MVPAGAPVAEKLTHENSEASISQGVIVSMHQVASRCATRYNHPIIKSFKHKGLKLFFKKGKTSGIQTKHAKRLRMQLAAIHTAQDIDDINLPGFSLHQFKGERSNIWSISINGNWRVTFEFTDGNAYILNYEDYH